MAKKTVREALSEIGDHMTEAILLRRYDIAGGLKLSHEELATRWGVSTRAVKSAERKGLKALAEKGFEPEAL